MKLFAHLPADPAKTEAVTMKEKTAIPCGMTVCFWCTGAIQIRTNFRV